MCLWSMIPGTLFSDEVIFSDREAVAMLSIRSGTWGFERLTEGVAFDVVPDDEF